MNKENRLNKQSLNKYGLCIKSLGKYKLNPWKYGEEGVGETLSKRIN